MRHFTVVLLLALALPPAGMARGGADLSVSASATVTVRNHGPAAANGARLTDVLAGPYSFVSATASHGSCSIDGATVTCSLGTIKKGNPVQVAITLDALDAGDLRNAVSARSRRTDPKPRNNSASTLTSVPRAGCTVTGTAARDRLVGTPGDDIVCGLGGNDVLRGLGGNDILYGGSGNDRLVGGAGDDRLRGERGGDTADFRDAPGSVQASLRLGVASGHGADQLTGIERLQGSRYADVLRGSAARNRISAGGGADRVYGGGGADKLFGRGGNDRLEGGRGRDVLYGGRGRDYCRSGRRISC
jgi:hypothetical protein